MAGPGTKDALAAPAGSPPWWAAQHARRQVLRGSAAGAAALGLASIPAGPSVAAAGPAPAVALPRAAGDLPGSPPPMHWLGRDWWTTRPKDWLLREGRLENHAPRRHGRGRVVSNLVTELTGRNARLRVTTGTLRGGRGFSGLLLGAGVRGLDHRARALVGSASGTGGGVFVTYEADGRVRVRDHSTEDGDVFAYRVLATGRVVRRSRRRRNEQVELDVRVRRLSGRRRRLVVQARDAGSGRLLSVVRHTLPARLVDGGVGLVSSDDDRSGARHWFADFRATGPGARTRPDRGVGPVVGTLFSHTGGRLRLTAQLVPLDPAYAGGVRLERRSALGWVRVAQASVGPGFVAQFDVPWVGFSETAYRVVVGGLEGTPGAAYEGSVPAEPDGGLRIATVSCARAAFRANDVATGDGPLSGRPRLPGERRLGRYTGANLWFPYEGVVAGVRAQRPDLLVAHGDQFYEDVPAGGEPEDADLLDVMGRYLLWVWAFAEVTRNTPSVLLIDDHDVYQPNLWGAGGQRAPGGFESGGFTRSIDWVNAMVGMQTGHNPPPASAQPVGDGLRTYYGSFTYGGVELAVLEDRTFKSGPRDPRPVRELDLLGPAQEEFVADWLARTGGAPRVLLTQTAFVALQTDARGRRLADKDSGGWPGPARDRFIDLLAGQDVLIVSGDQHMGSLVRHDHPGGGPWQFTGTAVAAGFQRWFEPGGRRNLPRRWTDSYGNGVEVVAVVQPDLTRRAYASAYPDIGVYGQQQNLNEGYGLVVVDADAGTAQVAAWPREVDPRSGGARPYPGFPRTVPVRSGRG